MTQPDRTHFQRRQWHITEQPFRPCDQPHMETLFTIGNGLVGTRGSFEEGYPGENPTTLAAGIFNHAEGELVPELVALPNWLSLRVRLDGDLCRMDVGEVLGYERVLELQTATLRRGLLWRSPAGKVLRLLFERFASLDTPHLLALRVRVQALSHPAEIQIVSALDGTQTNPGDIDHWHHLDGYAEGATLSLKGTTGQSGYRVAMMARLEVADVPAQLQAHDASERHPAHEARFDLERNQMATVTKFVSLHTTRDAHDPTTAAAHTLEAAAAQGYDALKAAHDAAWARYWQNFDIEIEGDEIAQRALRFCTYHVLIATPTQDENVSIAAKTLSGHGYKGHVFWDAELFLVPPMTLSQPELARRLLMYRYHNLPGARRKAAAAGYAGAMYPWESTDTGDEATPQYVGVNRDIRIDMGDNEQHISSDIAYAVLQYWRWTRDDDWFVRYGAEMVLDTAVFWGSRADYNAEQDRYELRTVIGPDEYHENVDNSVFTNRLVQWHLAQALSVLDWLHEHHPDAHARLTAALHLTPQGLERWRAVADKLWIPLTEQGAGTIYEQFEGFFERLQPLNLADYQPRMTNVNLIIGLEAIERTRVIKQADVVMLMALLGAELGDEAFLRRNWDAYLPITDHGSSLSPAIHAWVGARLGLTETAYEHVIYAATLDLEDRKGNVRDGMHAASCGGVWQAVILGFCGLHLTPEGPAIAPNLPAHWRRVRFSVWYGGQRYAFDIQP